jgi:hypothetical protein
LTSALQADPHYGGANFGHNEARNGYTTVGEYRVLLPDGRTQVPVLPNTILVFFTHFSHKYFLFFTNL